MFDRPVEATLSLSRDSKVCWLNSVKEAILTREHQEKFEQERLKSTLHAFFHQNLPPKWHINGLFRSPFSKEYYMQIKTRHRNYSGGRVAPQHICRSTRCPGKHLSGKSRTLWQYGFTLAASNSRLSKQIIEAGVNENEFSGTRVSTGP